VVHFPWGCTLGFLILAFLQITNSNVVCVLGKPVDLMARRVLAAATNELAQELSQYLGRMDLRRDDE